MRRIPLKRGLLAGFLTLCLIVFIVVHTYFAGWLLDYVNGVLGNIKGYQGSAQSINIDLYRGAYRINNLVINKKDGNIPTPFISIGVVDFSVQWSALLHGRIVSDMTVTKPVINFAVNHASEQNGTDVDWTKPIKDLMPIDINHMRFKDGSITYQDFSSTPQVNVYIHQMSGEVSNLRNVEADAHGLPSPLDIKGTSIGSGNLKIHGRLNILKDVPDMNLMIALENVDLPAINNYSEAYAAFDFNSGSFDLYSHLIIKDEQVTGYVKPMATHLSVKVLKSANPVQIAWDTAVAAILKVFTNPTKDQFATRADLQGSLGSISTDIWSTVGGIIYNAFVNAMNKGFTESGDENLVKPEEQTR